MAGRIAAAAAMLAGASAFSAPLSTGVYLRRYLTAVLRRRPVCGEECRIRGLGSGRFRVWPGLRHCGEGLGFRVWGLGFRF